MNNYQKLLNEAIRDQQFYSKSTTVTRRIDNSIGEIELLGDLLKSLKVDTNITKKVSKAMTLVKEVKKDYDKWFMDGEN